MAGLRRLRLLLASIGILAVGFGTAIAATFDGAPATPTPVKDTAAYSDLDVHITGVPNGAFDLDSYPVWE